MNRRTFTLTSALGITGSLLFGCNDNTKFAFKKNQVIACIGDSVTAASRKGYVELLQQIADLHHPELNLTFLNWGLNSETITGKTEAGHPGPRPYLFERLDMLLENTDVDLVTFCYGINCGIYGKPSAALFDSFRIGILSFIEKVKQKNIAAVLITPPPLALKALSVPTNDQEGYSWKNPYRNYDEEVLQKFKEIVLNIKHDIVVTNIDIHTPLSQNQLKYYTLDAIHPNQQGHELIANTIARYLNLTPQ